ncbi:MAG: ABC transporter permease subunit [Planctomycetaceae bacterium]|nr:ABC transporter permease subunit [Planctomycetaceae bacterium]
MNHASFAARLASRLACILLIATCARLAPSQETKPPRVRVGSKSYTESVILGEMLTLLASAAGARAEHRAELGGTQIAYSSLKKGEIDAYPEYTGTLTMEILGDQQVQTDEDIAAALARNGIKMSRRLGFNNSYALGMRRALADELKIAKISDLKQHPGSNARSGAARSRLKFGFSDEFMNREDGWPGLSVAYGLSDYARGLDHNLAYAGIRSGTIHVTDVYTTDPEIAAYEMKPLEDDLRYFPQYDCVLLYRADLDQRAPQVVANWLRLEGAIDEPTMIKLNARSRIDRVFEGRVAGEFLNGTLGMKVTIPPDDRWRRVLVNLAINTRQHLMLVCVSLLAAIVVAVPLGILAYRLPPARQLILGGVGILQTLPSMAVLMFLLPLLGLGAWPTIAALFLYSLLPIVRNTFAGLNEIPANLRESATVLGLGPRARLWLVELPMASRSILSGIKTAAVINVGTATIGGLIGAGGYGQPIITGTRLNDITIIMQGAIPAALMALAVQGLFELAERFVVPKGLRIAAGKST